MFENWTQKSKQASIWEKSKRSNSAFVTNAIRQHPLITGGKVCYAEPQELTDIVREALKDRKPLPTASGEETATPKTKDEEEAAKTRSSN
uniref:Uncharacterized protein n=1 Tax=Anopheles christyi TaxID=43041 RepID=A0A182KCR9_9DIPT